MHVGSKQKKGGTEEGEPGDAKEGGENGGMRRGGERKE